MAIYAIKMNGIRNAQWNLADNLEKHPVERLRREREDNISMYLKQRGCENLRWMELAQVCVLWRFSVYLYWICEFYTQMLDILVCIQIHVSDGSISRESEYGTYTSTRVINLMDNADGANWHAKAPFIAFLPPLQRTPDNTCLLWMAVTLHSIIVSPPAPRLFGVPTNCIFFRSIQLSSHTWSVWYSPIKLFRGTSFTPEGNLQDIWK
jgi:hypothetical protein